MKLTTMNRKIKKIIVHCAATPPSMDIGVDTIRKWHVEDRKWSDIGYHYVVRLDGSIEIGRPISRQGAHTKGYNKESVGICYVGGVNEKGDAEDTRTDEQKKSLKILLEFLKLTFPDSVIHGHRDFANKACPSFDATEEYKHI